MSKNKEIETYNDNFIILRNKIKEQDDLICELIKESNEHNYLCTKAIRDRYFTKYFNPY